MKSILILLFLVSFNSFAGVEDIHALANAIENNNRVTREYFQAYEDFRDREVRNDDDKLKFEEKLIKSKITFLEDQETFDLYIIYNKRIDETNIEVTFGSSYFGGGLGKDFLVRTLKIDSKTKQVFWIGPDQKNWEITIENEQVVAPLGEMIMCACGYGTNYNLITQAWELGE